MKMKKLFVALVLLVGITAMGFSQEAGSKGVYAAAEYSFSEFFPINFGLKVGIEKVYGHIGFACDPFADSSFERNFDLVAGVGSILPITGAFFFNPEILLYGNFKENQSHFSLVPYFGFNIAGGLSLLFGPSVTWSRVTEQYSLRDPSFAIMEETYSSNNNAERNSIVIAARAALRLRF